MQLRPAQSQAPSQICLQGAPCLGVLPLLFLSMADCRSQLHSFLCLLTYFSSVRLNSLWCNSQEHCSLDRAQAGLGAVGGRPQWAALPVAPVASLVGLGFLPSLKGNGKAGASNPARRKQCIHYMVKLTFLLFCGFLKKQDVFIGKKNTGRIWVCRGVGRHL